MKGGARAKWLSLLISGLVLAMLYRNLDLPKVAAAFTSASVGWLVGSISMIIVVTALRTLRFLRAAPAGSVHGIGQALGLTLVAAAFNLFFPAKSGDLIKSYFMSTRGGVSAGVSVSVIVYERVCDVTSILTWCTVAWLVSGGGGQDIPNAIAPAVAAIALVGWVLVSVERSADVLFSIARRLLPSKRLKKLRDMAQGWPKLHRELRGRRYQVVGLSLLVWMVGLTQLWMFTVAMGLEVPFLVGVNLCAIATLAGQVPFTFAGLGTRDLAFVILLAPYGIKEAAAGVGILASTRTFLPSLASLPILRPYLSEITEAARAWRSRRREEA